MKKNKKNNPPETSMSQGWSNLKKTIVGIGALGLIGLIADVLGLVSFFGPDEPKVTNQTNINNPNYSTNTSVVNDYSISSTVINKNTNFIDKSTYNCEVTNQIIVSSSNSEGNHNVTGEIIKAANYFCDNNNQLAYEYISRYDVPPPGVNPVGFYTLKGNIVFFEKKYDLAYQYLLKAFYLDKSFKYLDLPKLKGLALTYAQLLQHGHNLKDLKNIEQIGKKYVFDVGSKKIEEGNTVGNGVTFIAFHKIPTKEEEELLKVMQDLKMMVPTSTLK
jgi:hypothetical protein